MDYDVMYNGMVIGNLQAGDDEEALRNARLIYSGGKHGEVTVERV